MDEPYKLHETSLDDAAALAMDELIADHDLSEAVVILGQKGGPAAARHYGADPFRLIGLMTVTLAGLMMTGAESEEDPED